MSRAKGVEVALRAGAHLGEGPVWDADRRVLLWVDILAGIVHRFDPASGRDVSIHVGQPVGAAVPRVSGGLALALRDGFALMDVNGAYDLVANVELDLASNRMNDGKCDAAGRYWAGTMDEAHSRPGAGSLYRLDLDTTVTRVLDGVTISNGLDWSPDGATMYYIDTPTQGIDAYDFDAEIGEIANSRRIIDIDPADGAPDGMTVDAEGYLWVALWGGWGLRRYAPTGALDRFVAMPVSRVTSCAFGGADLGDLYVTSAQRALSKDELAAQPLAGSLFRLRPGVSGLLPHPFGA